MVGTSILHGGPAFPFLPRVIYDYIAREKMAVESNAGDVANPSTLHITRMVSVCVCVCQCYRFQAFCSNSLRHLILNSIWHVYTFSSYLIIQLDTATTDDQLQEVLAEPNVNEAVMSCGISKPISRLTIQNKEEVLKLLCLCDVLFDCKSAIDQFMNGLDEVNFVFKLGPNLNINM